MNDPTPYCVVQTTVADENQAHALAKKMVEMRLAACVQVQAIKSFYVWEGKPCADKEYLLHIKTRCAQYQALEDFIRSQHPYQTPEIIQLPIAAGFAGYLRWVDEAVNQVDP